MVLEKRLGLLALVESDLNRVEDAQLLREQSMIAARLASLNADGQTRFSAAVSEMAHHIVDCGDKGDGGLYVELGSNPQALIAAFTCRKCEFDHEAAERKFPGVGDPEPIDGPRFACRLVDFNDSQEVNGEDVWVLMGMEIPIDQPQLSLEAVQSWVSDLAEGIQRDPLTELRRQNESLRDSIDSVYKLNLALGEARTFFGSVLDTVPNPVFYQNPEGQFLGCNGAFERAFAVKRQTLSQYDPKKVFGQSRATALFQATRRALKTNEPQMCEVTLAFADGIDHHLIFSTSPFTRTDGKIGGIVGLISDITAQKQLENELRRMATTDPLTGSANRRHFLECAWREISHHRRKKKPVSLIMLDIDHFKGINDGHGHAIGDAILKSFVDTCRRVIRDVDLLARIGGEEFVILLPDTDEDGATRVSQKIRQAIAEIRVPNASGRGVGFKVSMGIVEAQGDGVSIEEMMRQADSALYSAKRSGRDRVAVFKSTDDPNIILA